jgi:hypothetical protein
VIHGLQAASDLAEANPQLDLNPVVAATEKLADDGSREIRNRANALLIKLRRPSISPT